ncbi:MAG: alpha/beta hydrolase [Chloroflexota bacterium]|nr:alpha/beta hydrolase [Chloroflexota bacterium]
MMQKPFTTVLISDVCYAIAGGKHLLLDIVQPDPPPQSRMPVIVEIHPGGWMYGEKYGPRNQLFAEHGFFTVSINHRLSGEATFPAQIEDVKMAVRWLRVQADTYHLDPQRIGVWGESSGGHLAALLGTAADRQVPEGEPVHALSSAQVQAVATISGPTDLLLLGNAYVSSLLGGPPQDQAELARLANPLTFLNRHHPVPPFLIIHGTQDSQVPFQQAVLFHEALKAVEADVTFRSVEAGHNLLGSHQKETCQALLLDFFTKYLSG